MLRAAHFKGQGEVNGLGVLNSMELCLPVRDHQPIAQVTPLITQIKSDV